MIEANKYSANSETYQIFGGSAVSINLSKGDSVEVIDVEGDQLCSVLTFDKKGFVATNSLNWQNPNNKKPTPHKKAYSSTLLAVLDKHKINTDNLTSIALFNKNSIADSRQTFSTVENTLCIFEADEGLTPMIEQKKTPTEILINILRLQPKTLKNILPKPLAKIAREMRIKQSTAQAYKVKRGEYIQIIDVEGHQCSDFQVFPIADLNNNIESPIDATVTRSFILLSYPEPGVNDKFYNQNSEPLIEVVQDTVSRHDTFGLACNAKYYEDRGFPGHISCTDNFNKVLAKHNIKKRNNWTAINFFFNTEIKTGHSLSSDVSWSRAGDYILLKALTDLVCVSSACPDDTSPANNWQPTDIHIRIYDKNNIFSPATAFRPDPQTITTMTKETGFHKNTKKLTKNYSNYNGYWLPLEYNNLGAIKEYWQCRDGVVMIDLSPLRKFEIYGPDAETLMQYAITKDVRRLAVGQVIYSAICYDNGCMLDDGTLFRLCADSFRWVCGSDYCGKWLRKLAKEKNLKVWVKLSTEQIHNLAVQGPKSRETLKKIIWTKKTQPPLADLKWFRFTIGRIGGENGIAVMVSRTGYSGELGYEIFTSPQDCYHVWNAVSEAGAEFNIAPLGLNALDMLRIEAGLIFAGYEFCDQTDPFEAGIAFAVPLKTKDDDFCGKESLIKRKKSPQRILVGLELETNEPAKHGDGVYVARQQVGIVTSAMRSPILKKNIALCRISITNSSIGTLVEVGKLDGHHKRIKATVVRFPFYDPDKTRVRM